MSGWYRYALALLLLGPACDSGSSAPRRTAEAFVDQHYVHMNLTAAEAYCAGLALRKLREEQRLVAGQVIDDSTRKPTVHYRLLDTQGDAEHPTFVFEGTIDVADAGRFTRKWLVSTRREAGEWKVSNFEEFD